MATAQLAFAFRQIQKLVRPGGDELSDSQLVERFVTEKSSAAFAGLLRRHGPLVLGVCRRVLHSEHDAEDAFQATFLVLARKAGSIRNREVVVSWLYRVAYHIATKARADAARRASHERQAGVMPKNGTTAHEAWREVRTVLDEEIARLPEKYRRPIILCYLEEKTNEQAAQILGWTKGTVSGRLARARDLLRRRLARRGLAMSAGLMPLMLPATASAVPAVLTHSTLDAALAFAVESSSAAISPCVAALAESAMQSLGGLKLRLLSVLLLVAGFWGVPAGLLLSSGKGGDSPDGKPAVLAQAPMQAPVGDQLPGGALSRLGTTRLRHGHLVMGIAFAPDGKTFVSAGQDHLARLWDTATGKEIRSFGEHADRLNPYARTRWVYSVAISPDGKTLATGDHNTGWPVNTIRLWDIATGKELRRLQGHQQGVTSLSFSPDGRILASGAIGGAIRLWEIASGRELLQLDAGVGPVTYVAFAADGKLLVAHGANMSVRLWDVSKDLELRQREKSFADVLAAACSPDGKLLALGNEAGAVRLVQTATGQETHTLTGHTGMVRIAFSPDGKSLVTGGGDKTVRLWDRASGKLLHKLTGHFNPLRSVAISGDRVASVDMLDHAIHMWDVRTGKEIETAHGHLGTVSVVGFASDGSTLYSTSWDQTLRRWDIAGGKELHRQSGPHVWSRAIAFAPDGKVAALGGADGIVRVIDAATGQELRQLRGHDKDVLRATFAPAGSILVTAGADKSIRVWDAATGQELHTLPGPFEGVNRVLVSPDGKRVAWNANDQIIHLCDTAGGKQVFSISHEANVTAAAFSPDNKLLATGTNEGKAYLWDVNSGQQIRELAGHAGYVMSVGFSPDGRSMAVGSWMSVRLWEIATGQERVQFSGHEGDQVSLAFAPNARRLASGGGGTTAIVWDLTGRATAGAPAAALSAEDLATAWADLLGEDAAKSYRALWTLASAPRQALPRLREALKPSAPTDAQRIDKLVADLDHDEFDAREKASQELAVFGEQAEPSLRKAFNDTTSAEVRRRAQNLLDKLKAAGAGSQSVRTARLLETLEQMDSPEARQLLKTLAKGDPKAWRTQEAQRALARQGRSGGNEP